MMSNNNLWDTRYAQSTFVYGTKPNTFFKQELQKINPGTLLLPAEGEGRNAVFAASLGWQVLAFDSSIEAQKKAKALAAQKHVEISYSIANALTFSTQNQVDVIGLIFTHFPNKIKATVFKNIVKQLRLGGILIFECFSKNQLGKTSGGPKDIEMLFSLEDVKSLFPGVVMSFLEEKNIILNEGPLHQGKASVIRFVAQKQMDVT